MSIEDRQLQALAHLDDAHPPGLVKPIDPTPAPKPQHQIYLETQEALYLRLMSRMQAGNLPIEVKRHEIARLHNMRQAALEKLQKLSQP